MRIALIGVAIALLAACNNPPTGDEPSGPVGAGGPVGENVANRTGETTDPQPGELPARTEGLRFLGNWAADERSCETTAWQFTQTTMRTPAGLVCVFNRVTEVPGGYDIQATCTAEGPPTSDTLRLRFAESADAMLFESEAIADAGLVFCGRDV